MVFTADWWTQPAVIASAIAIAVAMAGGLLTEIGPWYKSLKNPSWKPPDWAFGPIWTVIFTMTVFAAVYAWEGAQESSNKVVLIAAFGLNCILNIAWSALFFKLKRPDWALIESVFLWLSILLLIIVCFQYSKISALMLLPYLVWVSIATVLNRVIIRLNGPFGGRA
jgi:translocator protein